jgi:tetratricopeptide (TPR) repeat protein
MPPSSHARGSRKPTPVEVFYFPKKARRPAPRLTQTIPEIALTDIEIDVVTEIVEAEPVEEGRRKRRRTRSGSMPRVTLSDEHPDDVAQGLSALAQLGHELFVAGRVQESKAVFEGLVVSNPEDAFAHTMLGTISLALHDVDRALSLFEAALAVEPGDLAALVYRGEIRLNRKKYVKAMADFERALALGSPDDPFTDRARRLLKMAKKAQGPRR